MIKTTAIAILLSLFGAVIVQTHQGDDLVSQVNYTIQGK